MGEQAALHQRGPRVISRHRVVLNAVREFDHATPVQVCRTAPHRTLPPLREGPRGTGALAPVRRCGELDEVPSEPLGDLFDRSRGSALAATSLAPSGVRRSRGDAHDSAVEEPT